MVNVTLLELHTGDMDLGKYGSKLSTVADEVADDEDLSNKIDVQTDSDSDGDDSSGGKGKALLLSLLLLAAVVAAVKFMGGGDDFEDLEELEDLDDLAERP